MKVKRGCLKSLIDLFQCDDIFEINVDVNRGLIFEKFVFNGFINIIFLYQLIGVSYIMILIVDLINFLIVIGK